MRLRDGPDDRETEAAAAAGGRVGRSLSANKPVEDLRLHVSGDAGPVVEDLEQRLVAVTASGELDRGLLRRVPDGVLEQIADQPVKLVRIALQRQGLVEVALDAASAREKLTAGAQLLQVYTGYVYRGPGLLREIAEGLTESD
jgi:hypothetical protein